MKYMERIIFGGIAVLGLGSVSAAFACSPDGWTSQGDHVVAPSLVGTPVDGVARYSEFCAFSVDGDSSYVQSNHTGDTDTRYIGRFYVYPHPGASGTVDIFIAYSDEGATAQLFKATLDGTDLTFTFPGDTATASVVSGNWNLIEFDYNSTADADTFSYWVNEPWDSDALVYEDGDGDSGTVAMTAGDIAVRAVQLGAPNGGLTGKLNFDAFEAHRTQNVGALLRGDANADESVNIIDYSAVQAEILGTLQAGQPDCNEDGQINILDYGCIQTVILGG